MIFIFDCVTLQTSHTSCPNVGRKKVHQPHCALENHLFYGKCEFLSVIETLMDKTKVLYHDKLVCEASVLHFVKGVSHQCPTATEALRSSKKSTWFIEAQRWYLESKFNVRQETGLKRDPVDVARATVVIRGISRGQNCSQWMNS